MSLIEPRTLKGFRDYLPQAMLPRERPEGVVYNLTTRLGILFARFADRHLRAP